MNTVNKNAIEWKQKGAGFTLHDGLNDLVVIEKMDYNGAGYAIDGKKFTLQRSAFSGKFKVTSHNGVNVLELKFSFWGSTGQAKFSNGRLYPVKFKNNPLLSLEVADDRKAVLFTYDLEQTKNYTMKLKLNVFKNETHAEEFLHLMVLGYTYMSMYAASDSDQATFLSIVLH